MNDFSEIGYVYTVTIGELNMDKFLSNEDKQKQIDLLNRCLNDTPRGKILITEKGTANYKIGEHQFILEKITYHIGFASKPCWLDEK